MGQRQVVHYFLTEKVIVFCPSIEGPFTEDVLPSLFLCLVLLYLFLSHHCFSCPLLNTLLRADLLCQPVKTKTRLTAKPEIPVKPETPAKPETPVKPETPAKPETPET